MVAGIDREQIKQVNKRNKILINDTSKIIKMSVMTSSRPAMINHNKGAEHHGNRSNRNLNDQAHAIFSENSIHELINLDRESALERLKYFYGPEIDTEKVTKYLAIVERVRIGICDA